MIAKKRCTYDNGCFNVWTQIVDIKEVFVQYVRILKDIFKLNYDLRHTPIIILNCEWIKWKDNQSNPTYVWDHVGFLIIIFDIHYQWHLGLSYSHAMWHVFFFEDLKNQSWKVVLNFGKCIQVNSLQTMIIMSLLL